MRSGGRTTWLLLALVACGATLLALWRPTHGPRPTTARPEPASAFATAPDASVPTRAASTERAVQGASSGSQLDPAPERPARLRARGRVRDPLGAPVADVGVGTQADRARDVPATRSGADGTFELVVEAMPQTLVAVDPRWVSVRSATAFEPGTGPEAVLVVAPSIELAGRVVDPSGVGLSAVNLRIDAPLQGLADSAELLAITQRELWITESAGDGGFILAAVPALEGARLVASLRGYETRTQELPRDSLSGLEITLIPLAPDRRIVAGTVVHADGTPAAGAGVRFGDARARADERGAFRLTFGSVGARTPLLALQPGHQPAILPGFGATALAGPLPLEPVRLVLGGAALSIQGRVLDAAGEPLARWNVELLDGTPADPLAGTAPWVEELGSGQDRSVRTDKQGHFLLAGLSARSYVLRAHGSRPRAQILSAPVEAGSRDVELRLPPAEAPTALRGRVLSLAGEAVSDARVALAPIGSRRPGEPSPVAAGVTTGPDGSFLLDAVPSGWIELVVEGDGILPASRLLAPGESRDDVRLLVEPRRRFRFESALAQDPPDELRAVDAEGFAVPLWTLDVGTPRAAARARLREGRSEELSVSEVASELVIYRRGEELDRLELALLPDELASIVWP